MEGEKPENSVNMEIGAFLRASSIEGPSLPIIGHKLNGQNFIQWARSVRIFLQGQGKEGYITGDSKEPDKGDSNLLQKLPQQTMLNTRKNGGTATVAQKGNFSTALNASERKTQSWIVDSGASDHMTGDITVFNDYSPSQDHSTVRIADGTLSKVIGKGSVVISRNITLNSVLYVPKLDCNLLSISKLTKDLNCITMFSLNLCEFQTLESGKTIGSAKECGGLYLLQVEASKNEPKANSCAVGPPNSEDSVMLWHYRLGHPNFVYLERMFPSLFNKNKRSFQCEVCQLSKHAVLIQLNNTSPLNPSP